MQPIKNQPLQRAPAAEDAAEAADRARARRLPHTRRQRQSNTLQTTAATRLRRCSRVYGRRRARAPPAASAASPAAGAPSLSHGVVLCPVMFGRATAHTHNNKAEDSVAEPKCSDQTGLFLALFCGFITKK